MIVSLRIAACPRRHRCLLLKTSIGSGKERNNSRLVNRPFARGEVREALAGAKEIEELAGRRSRRDAGRGPSCGKIAP
jgi:hypothetical protein